MNSPSRLIIMAGSTEAGKSSAGQYFSELGAIRMKIREILLPLTSGHIVSHEGVLTRQDFAPSEFISSVLAIHATLVPGDILVIESFIDAALATQCRDVWPGQAVIIFIDAPFELRVARLVTATGLAEEVAESIVRRKDQRKQVKEQWQIWESVADAWIDNTGSPERYRLALRQVIALVNGMD
jgi:dephospho-CoA kinase